MHHISGGVAATRGLTVDRTGSGTFPFPLSSTMFLPPHGEQQNPDGKHCRERHLGCVLHIRSPDSMRSCFHVILQLLNAKTQNSVYLVFQQVEYMNLGLD